VWIYPYINLSFFYGKILDVKHVADDSFKFGGRWDHAILELYITYHPFTSRIFLAIILPFTSYRCILMPLQHWRLKTLWEMENLLLRSKCSLSHNALKKISKLAIFVLDYYYYMLNISWSIYSIWGIQRLRL